MLQNASSDPEKLEALLKAKGREKEEAMHTQKTHKVLFAEIEMLKVVLQLVTKNMKEKDDRPESLSFVLSSILHSEVLSAICQHMNSLSLCKLTIKIEKRRKKKKLSWYYCYFVAALAYGSTLPKLKVRIQTPSCCKCNTTSSYVRDTRIV